MGSSISAPAHDRDWSTLPGDLVCLVSGRLHDPLDFLRLRAVCRSWRSAAASPPLFLPWLLSHPCPDHPTTSAFSFYSIASGATRSVPCPAASLRHLLGPTSSHLLLSDNPHLLLLNPLTGARLSLPDSPFPASGPMIQGYLISNGAESPAPVVLYSAKKLFFCFGHPDPAEGEPTNLGAGWTEVPVTSLVAENMYHRGRLFVYDENSHITAFDASTLAVVGAVAPPPATLPSRDACRCTAFVPSGDELLCVIRYFAMDGCGEQLDDCGVLEVYRLEMGIGRRNKEDKQREWWWVRMSSIGDRILFVGLYQGFSFRAADFPGFKGDCIYFFKVQRSKRSCIYRFSMEDGRTEELPGPRMHACTWFVPSLS